ncbi:hypothetical protein KKB54_05740 [bacterium]|nr:hypothetical protein [bacterium]MBU0900295.1 hypothetical protein [bacterium]MBU1153369.1 hypothetical protein [bacterium]MBU1781949.1 hypothetical protein [bacterium]MBU2599271.1 hypothetical protein [bacterium]
MNIDKSTLKIKQEDKNVTSEKTVASKPSFKFKEKVIEETDLKKRSNKDKILDIAEENLLASQSKLADTEKAKELLESIQGQISEKSNLVFNIHSNIRESDLSDILSS